VGQLAIFESLEERHGHTLKYLNVFAGESKIDYISLSGVILLKSSPVHKRWWRRLVYRGL
jgi:hypothetical protein